MPAVFQSLASIARMPPPGITPNKSALKTSSSSSFPSATATETVPASIKPKLTLTVLTDYCSQLEATPVTSDSKKIREPSSTTAECGEGLGPDANTLSAAARADLIFKKWIAAGMPDDIQGSDATEEVKDTTTTTDKEKSDSTDVATPKVEEQPAELPSSSEENIKPSETEQATRELLHDRVTKFLESIGQPPTRSERNDRLAKENRSLQKQIASLQRTAQTSMKEKHNLSTQVTCLKQHHEAEKRRLHEETKREKSAYEAKVMELEEQLAKQKTDFENQLAHQKADFEQQLAKQREELSTKLLHVKESHAQELANQRETLCKPSRHRHRSPSPTPSTLTLKPTPKITITNTDIASWFSTRSTTWYTWATDYAHLNPNRLVELHPIQHDELRRGISHFVRLTADNKLPEQFIAYTSSSNNTRMRALLYGMLSNFIITECFSSPWWVFKALRKTGNPEVDESPTVERISGQRADEPAGFSVDVATWENISPPILSPGILVSTEMAEPATARSMTFMSPRLTNPGHVSMQSLGVITAVGVDGGVRSSVEVGRLPAEEELEGLFELLGKVQSLPASSPTLCASLLRILHEGGLSLDATHPSIAGNGARRMLAECRREYARKLKDRFLSGPARFLLRDQTPEGIIKLEGALMSELNAALKFSSLVWARQDGDVHFKGLEELDMEGENIQVWEGADGKEAAHARPSSSASPTSQGEKPPSVMVVLQPAITCTTFSSSMSSDATAHCRSSSSASDRSSPESKPELHTATTTISKALILLSNAFSPSSLGANSCPSTPSSTNSRPSTPQNRTSSSTLDCEEIMTPDIVVSLRLSMAACPGTPADPTQKSLDSLETLPGMASKCGKRSPKPKLRNSRQLKLGGGGWTKEVVEGREQN